jgi:hypothetical protein
MLSLRKATIPRQERIIVNNILNLVSAFKE